MRTIDWVDDHIELIDQTKLPGTLEILKISQLPDLIGAIQRLSVRGAPALGVAGAMGTAMLAQQIDDPARVRELAEQLADARPTAVNLSWGVKRALERLQQGPDAVLAQALQIRDDDIAACHSMGEYGADLIAQLTGSDSVRVMTICNTGALAAVERGTALGVVQTLFERGQLTEAIPVETRPLLQGARLTAWELQQMHAPFRLAVDSAGPFLLSRDYADVVVIGADRIAANGDTANKIGSYALAVGAKAAGVPFLVVAPESTIDSETASGSDIPIEDRGVAEVAQFGDVRTAPDGIAGLNPAFDVTPAQYITAIVTDRRVIRLDRQESPMTTPLGATRRSTD